ncbi:MULTISPECIES: beta-phosphoglucomutase [Thermoanaerobacter]|uniref:Beta-phosphoglucomutase n=1 Tax=Thermoanaerobacter thermohydrosulfuricus WC1 TaxID=1198630 RepID=M8DJ07_THETY|nr:MULTISPECIES: beta-phosphoglucomutase [Thermoanaerobacter]EMT40077.1 beta-phosphoglucomutase [Thermoanaerobacter thermohydrosulfuricus WC1]UZQ83776.1 beta-phosphoglucomutase [Thermoanaerobacter sp. RKWS2]
MARYQGVIFDLDGVITDTARYHYLAWKKLADELGIYFDEVINERLKGVSRLQSLEIILEKSDKKYSQEEKEYYANKKNEYYKEMIKKITPEDLLPGVERFIEELKKRGIKTAIASVSKNAFTVVENLKIKDKFDYIVDANEIKHGKPDPEIFLNAAEHLGIPPEKCIGIEDSAAGITAIKKAGMYAVGVGNPETVKEADLILKDLSETDKILELL